MGHVLARVERPQPRYIGVRRRMLWVPCKPDCFLQTAPALQTVPAPSSLRRPTRLSCSDPCAGKLWICSVLSLFACAPFFHQICWWRAKMRIVSRFGGSTQSPGRWSGSAQQPRRLPPTSPSCSLMWLPRRYWGQLPCNKVTETVAINERNVAINERNVATMNRTKPVCDRID